MRETLLQNPQHILSKGYAIVRTQATAVRSITQLNSSPTAQEIQIEMHDGIMTAEIQPIQVKIYE